MPATAQPLRPSSTSSSAPSATPVPRKPFRDNPRLILIGIGLLLAAFVVMIALASRSREMAPDFLSEVVLYALVAADLTMLVGLAFVLARNIVKLLVERRRALPFARFRFKLVAVLLGMTLIPSVMVLMVGSELIRSTAMRATSPPIEEVLRSAHQIASDYYQERQVAVTTHAENVAGALGGVDLRAGGRDAVQALIGRDVAGAHISVLEVYRVDPVGPGNVTLLVRATAPTLPKYDAEPSDQLAARIAGGDQHHSRLDTLPNGAQLVRSSAIVRGADGAVRGVVIASDYLTGEVARHARRITDVYDGYTQMRVLRRPLTGVYLSFFLMVTLMILVSATWMGLYLAKRITRPVQLLAAGAREIGAGHLDHRIERETSDEFGALVDAFNSMAAELATSQRKLERSRLELERNGHNLEGRKRFIETLLERIATGVVSIDASGRVSTINTAASRLLGVDRDVIGRSAADVFGRPELEPLATLLKRARVSPDQPAQEIALSSEGRDVHLAAAATALPGEDEDPDGIVVVMDDVTPLIRAQRVATWRDVARRLAHEIKNPLTPIQLCAERMRRHFTSAPTPARALVEECTGTIIGEVDSLKALVDEFSQFARMPAPRTAPSDLNAVVAEALTLYTDLFSSIDIRSTLSPDLPIVRVDAEQIRRVIINLADNAIEALGGAARPAEPRGLVRIETQHDPGHHVVRVIVSDNGPGIGAADREKLFMPYFSTKKRGSGLGLAIVRRIIVEHGGSIEASDNTPTGTQFVIELPTQ